VEEPGIDYTVPGGKATNGAGKDALAGKPLQADATLLVDATVAAAGGYHMSIAALANANAALNVLQSAYYPTQYLSVAKDTIRKLYNYQQFITAYENLLRGEGVTNSTQSVSTKNASGEILSKDALGVTGNQVWTFAKSGKGFSTVQMINMMGINAGWHNEEGYADNKTPDAQENLTVRLSLAGKTAQEAAKIADQVYVTSPDDWATSSMKKAQASLETDENGQPAASVVAKSPEGKEIGTFTVDKETGVVTFTPTDKSYSGDVVAVKVQAKDANGTPAETTYTPKITPVVPTAEDATSTDKQGQTQTGKPKFTEGDSRVPMDDDTPATFEDGSTTKTIPGEGTYTVAPDGTVTFVPEKSFTGTGTGVTVKRVDKNGTPVTAKYTPTVTPVTPTATPVETTDIQGATQTGKPKFTEGDPVVPMDDDVPATFEDGSTTKTIPGEGTYTVAPDGTVTFVPEKSFTGTGTGVTVKRVDKNGTPVTAKYTPTVTPVVPTAEDATSTDKQGHEQSGKPTFTPGNSNVPMDDDTPATFEDGRTTKTIPGEGTYTVAPDGTVTFVPEKSFTGKGTGVTVKRVDKNGTPVTAKYTPTVTPVTPTATPAESVAPQGVVQTGTVTFTEGDPVAPIDKDTITLLDENGQPAASVDAKSPAGDVIGTFTVDKETGVVTFTPTDKSYSGDVVPVKVQAADTNGTTVETTTEAPELPNTGTKTVGVWAAVVALFAGSMLVIVNKKNSQA